MCPDAQGSVTGEVAHDSGELTAVGQVISMCCVPSEHLMEYASEASGHGAMSLIETCKGLYSQPMEGGCLLLRLGLGGPDPGQRERITGIRAPPEAKEAV